MAPKDPERTAARSALVADYRRIEEVKRTALRDLGELCAHPAVAAMRALHTRFAPVARSIPAADDPERFLAADCGLIDGWDAQPGPWFDPCFEPVFTCDGDAIGALLHPPALEAGAPAPVMYLSHETGLSWIAESVAHLERMIDAAPRGLVSVDAQRGVMPAEAIVDRERALVAALQMAHLGETAEPCAELAGIYGARGWSDAARSLEAQRLYEVHAERSKEIGEGLAALDAEDFAATEAIAAEANLRLFANQVRFDLAGDTEPTTDPLPEDPRYGKRIELDLTPTGGGVGLAVIALLLGAPGALLVWLALHIDGPKAILLLLLALVPLTPLVVLVGGRVFAPRRIRFVLARSEITILQGLAWRRTRTIDLREVEAVRWRGRHDIGALSFQTEALPVELQGGMFPASFRARDVALRLWIRAVYASADERVGTAVVARTEAACEAALRARGTRFSWIALRGGARVVILQRAGGAPEFPGATDAQRAMIAFQVDEGRWG